jgi:hypothetical protein
MNFLHYGTNLQIRKVTGKKYVYRDDRRAVSAQDSNSEQNCDVT